MNIPSTAVFHVHNKAKHNSTSSISRMTTNSSGSSRCSSSGLQDVLVCATIGLMGWYSPKYMIWPLVGGVNMRPIPFQKTKAGDVILDMRLTNDLVEDVTFTGSQLIWFSVWLPMLVILVVSRITGQRSHLAGLCSASLAVGLSEFSTQVLKMYIGRLRPNFYDMCGFDTDTLRCTRTPTHYQHEARQSFPSGHSSLSFCGMGVLGWFLLGCWYHYCRRMNTNAQVVKMGIVLAMVLPLSLAAWISSSRLVDNWHHPDDVVAGALIGFSCATISYHTWFHPVLSNKAGYPITDKAKNVARELEEGISLISSTD